MLRGMEPRSSWACHCSGNQERPASGRGGDPVRKTLAVTSGCFWRWPRRRRRQIPTDLTLFRERRPPSAPPAETGDNDRPRPPDQPGGQGAVCGCYLRRDLPGARARRPALRSAFTTAKCSWTQPGTASKPPRRRRHPRLHVPEGLEGLVLKLAVLPAGTSVPPSIGSTSNLWMAAAGPVCNRRMSATTRPHGPL